MNEKEIHTANCSRFQTNPYIKSEPSKEKVHNIPVERVTQSMLTDRFEVAIADKFHLERIIEGSQEAPSPSPSPPPPNEMNTRHDGRFYLSLIYRRPRSWNFRFSLGRRMERGRAEQKTGPGAPRLQVGKKGTDI